MAKAKPTLKEVVLKIITDMERDVEDAEYIESISYLEAHIRKLKVACKGEAIV